MTTTAAEFAARARQAGDDMIAEGYFPTVDPQPADGRPLVDCELCHDVHPDYDAEPVQGPDGEPGPDAAGESYVWPGAEIIHAYTREQALADGALVDVTATAREAGIRGVDVAVTRAVWEGCVAWSDADNARKGTVQDEAGRLWDVVYMAAVAMRRNPGGDRVTVRLVCVPREGRVRGPRRVELVAAIGPGDRGEPVITVMEPGED